MSRQLITSTQNPRIKHVVLLQQKAQQRRAQGLIVVEGIREITHCINAGFAVETVFYCPALFDASTLSDTGYEIIEVTPHVYEKIAYRGSTEGVVAIVKPRTTTLQDLDLGDNPLLVVLEGVEKPGNIGAVLRSADAAQATAVIVCDPLTHDRRYGDCHGHRVDGTHQSLARGRRRPHPHPHERCARLAQRVGERGDTAL